MPKMKLTEGAVNKAQPGAKPFDVYDSELRGFYLRVQPSGVKTYYVVYRLTNGKQRRFKIGDAARMLAEQARREAKRILGLVENGQDPQADKQAEREAGKLEAEEPTLREFVDAHYAPHVRARFKSAENTLYRLEKNFDFLMDKKVSDIAGSDLLKWQTRRRHEARAPSAINRDLAVMRSCLSHAVALGMLTENPLRVVKDLKIDRAAKVRYLSESEERALFEALARREERIWEARKRGDKWRWDRSYPLRYKGQEGGFADALLPAVILSLNSGLRRGEVLNLRWRDVDFDTSVLTVEGSGSKSGRTRHVPLNATARDTLARWKAQSGDAAPEGYVFPSFSGGRMDNMNGSWHRVLKDAGIVNFRWHDMRHDFASKLAMAGIDLNTIRELLGHQSLEMTLRYSHLQPQKRAAAVAVLERNPASNVLPFPGAAEGRADA